MTECEEKEGEGERREEGRKERGESREGREERGEREEGNFHTTTTPLLSLCFTFKLVIL